MEWRGNSVVGSSLQSKSNYYGEINPDNELRESTIPYTVATKGEQHVLMATSQWNGGLALHRAPGEGDNGSLSKTETSSSLEN